MANMRMKNDRKRADAQARRRNKRVDELAASNIQARQDSADLGRARLEHDETTVDRTMEDRAQGRKHQTFLQRDQQKHATGLQESSQTFQGGQNQAERQFRGGQAGLDRDLRRDEGEKERAYGLERGKQQIAGHAFLGGADPTDVQILENSYGDNIEYGRTKGIPQQQKATNRYDKITSTDDEGKTTVLGAFDKQTGKEIRYGEDGALGGNIETGGDTVEDIPTTPQTKSSKPDVKEVFTLGGPSKRTGPPLTANSPEFRNLDPTGREVTEEQLANIRSLSDDELERLKTLQRMRVQNKAEQARERVGLGL